MHCREGIKEKFLADLKVCAAEMLRKPKEKLEGRVIRSILCSSFHWWADVANPFQAAVYGMAQTLPDKGLVEEMASLFVDALYNTDN